jgi:siderophore synthetase component
VTVEVTTSLRVDTDADSLSAHTLLGCLIRELSGPDGQVTVDAGHLLLRLPHIDQLLRAALLRVSTVAAHRFTGPVQRLVAGTTWVDLGLADLADLVDAELTARTGYGNDEFAAQVRASRDTLHDILATRPRRPRRPVAEPAATYLDSEQSLIAGHPRHPAPKWRSGELSRWRRFSPETRTAFPLRWLAVPEEFLHEHGDFDQHAMTAELLGTDGRLPAGYRGLPVHPWQFQLLSDDPDLASPLAAARADGALLDLGQVGLPFHPTASVRTLYQPETDVFLKTSLNVRITNCLRKNAAYELRGAVELTGALAGPIADVAARHPGFDVLPEPASRGVALPDHLGTAQQRHAVLEGFGTIVRTGVAGWLRPGERVHLAGALAAAQLDPAGTRTRLADLADQSDPAAWAMRWWLRYVNLLVPPVLRLWAEHGVVLEPHPQNVLAVLDADNMPSRVLVRDLEGTKLLSHRHTDVLAALPADVAEAAAYSGENGWNRIAYCLFVNHLTEIAGALADLVPARPQFEDELWDTLADVVASTGTDLGDPPRLRALLAGVPLPAKTNLLIRWQRAADRHAGYVPFPNPLGRALPEDIR